MTRQPLWAAPVNSNNVGRAPGLRARAESAEAERESQMDETPAEPRRTERELLEEVVKLLAKQEKTLVHIRSSLNGVGVILFFVWLIALESCFG